MKRRAFIRTMALSGALGAQVWGQPTAASSKFRAAVIGWTGRGDYGHSLETIFTNRPEVEVVTLADPDEPGRTRTVRKIGAARHYADYRELLRKERPQLVSVAMRHSDLHYEIALAALKAGAHIYCEKPFTTTPAEADQLLAEARQRRLRVAVAHTMKMTPRMRRFKRALEEGLIGELIELRACGKQDARAGGEDMMVLGTHLFDLLRWLAGDPLWCTGRVLWHGKDITAADGRLVQDNVGLVAGDEVFAQFAFANGVHASFVSAGKLRETTGHWGIELQGSKGTARINCDLPPKIFLRQAAAWKGEGKTEQWLPFEPALAEADPDHNVAPVSDWLEAIANDREPHCSGANGAWAIEMVMAVYRAALSGRRISFPLIERAHPLSKS